MKEHTIEIKCSCDEIAKIDLDQEPISWEIIETDEREMGTEYHYECCFDFSCANCRKGIEVSLNIWEYPEGVYNMSDIEVHGAKLVESCDLEDLFYGKDK